MCRVMWKWRFLLQMPECFHFSFFSLIDRHVYVADVLDHNVHVLERKADNTLVPVKVSFERKFAKPRDAEQQATKSAKICHVRYSRHGDGCVVLIM